MHISTICVVTDQHDQEKVYSSYNNIIPNGKTSKLVKNIMCNVVTFLFQETINRSYVIYMLQLYIKNTLFIGKSWDQNLV